MKTANDNWIRAYQARLAEEFANSPQEFKDVVAAFKASASAAGEHERAVHHCKEGEEYIVGDNFERMAGCYVLRGGEWFFRDKWSGEDRPVKGGVAEVLADASIAYTG